MRVISFVLVLVCRESVVLSSPEPGIKYKTSFRCLYLMPFWYMLLPLDDLFEGDPDRDEVRPDAHPCLFPFREKYTIEAIRTAAITKVTKLVAIMINIIGERVSCGSPEGVGTGPRKSCAGLVFQPKLSFCTA
jgi:hypothetical protein